MENQLIYIGHAFEALLRKKGYNTNQAFTDSYGVKYASFARYISGLKQGRRGGNLETLAKYLDFLGSNFFELTNFFENSNNLKGYKNLKVDERK